MVIELFWLSFEPFGRILTQKLSQSVFIGDLVNHDGWSVVFFKNVQHTLMYLLLFIDYL